MAEAAGAFGLEPDLLGIYLNDHLGAATGGVELFRRAAAGARGTPLADRLARLAAEIEDDRAALAAAVEDLGLAVRHYKVAAGWVAERVGRLKPNGRLVRRSPLSSLLEVELMLAAVAGKAAGWRTLRALADDDERLDPARFDALLERAQRQDQELTDLHRTAAALAFR
jgi:hypothetical protein